MPTWLTVSLLLVVPNLVVFEVPSLVCSDRSLVASVCRLVCMLVSAVVGCRLRVVVGRASGSISRLVVSIVFWTMCSSTFLFLVG